MAEEKREPSLENFNAGRSWLVFIAIFLAGIALSWTQVKVQPILTILMSALNLSAQASGWVMSLFNVLGIILAFPAVGIARKFGARRTGIAALLFAIIGSIIGFFSTGATVLMISRVIEGFGIGLITVIAPSMISAWFPASKRSAPLGIWSAWMAVAIACAFTLTGNILGPEANWKNMYILGFVLQAIGLIMFLLFAKYPPADRNFADIEDSSENMFSIFKNPSSWWITIVFFGLGVACMAFSSWISSYWGATMGWDTYFSNKIIGLMYVGEIITCALGGVILTKIVDLKKRKIFAIVCSAIYMVCFVALYICTGTPVILTWCVLFVIFEGIFTASMWGFVTLVPTDPSLAAPTISMATIGMNFGMMLGTPVAGAILDATAMTGWTYLAVLVGVCMALSTLGFIMVKIHNPGEPAV